MPRLGVLGRGLHRMRTMRTDRHLNRRDVFKANRDAALAEWRQLGAA